MENRNINVLINTSGVRQAHISLVNYDGRVLGECSMEGKSQMILPAFQKVLSDADVTFDDIGSISVHTGPGSFTGVRVGVAVAKTLALLLGLEVNTIKPWENTEILYEKDKFSHNPRQG